MEIFNIEAYNGDCYIIKEEDTIIMIDSGTNLLAKKISKKLKEIEKIDLLIITHIDNDHIGGILNLVRKDKNILKKFEKIWFNSYDLTEKIMNELNLIILEKQEEKSIAQGISFNKILRDMNKLEKNKKFGDILSLNELEVEVLAPFDEELSIFLSNWKKQLTEEKKKEEQMMNKSSLETSYSIDIDDIDEEYKEDTSIFNKSSIVVLIRNKKGKTVLFTGDTTSNILIKALKEKKFSKENKLKLDLLKLPHHGSKNNLSIDFLEMIDCPNYILSTNGGSFKHPDKECISRIIKNVINLEKIYINYEIQDFFTHKDKEKKYDELIIVQEKINI